MDSAGQDDDDPCGRGYDREVVIRQIGGDEEDTKMNDSPGQCSPCPK